MTKIQKHKKSSAWIAHKLLKVEDGSVSNLPTNKWLFKNGFDVAKKTPGFFKKSLAVIASTVALIGCVGFAVASFALFIPATAALTATACLAGGFLFKTAITKTLNSFKRSNMPLIQKEMAKRILSQQKNSFMNEWKANLEKNKQKKAQASAKPTESVKPKKKITDKKLSDFFKPAKPKQDAAPKTAQKPPAPKKPS